MHRRRTFTGNACRKHSSLCQLCSEGTGSVGINHQAITLSRQTSRRTRLWELLGDLPPRDRAIGVRTISTSECGTFRLERLILDLNGSEAVPAHYIRPVRGTPPFPAILYNHAHGGDYALGRDELLFGRSSLQSPSYAELLAGLGIAALSIDHWGFGERRGRSESEIFKEMLWHGQVLWGHMVYDSVRALDYLESRGDVNSARIGTLGLSMGSTMAWWVAALDPRLRLCVDICCLTDYEALIDTHGLDRHGLYYYVPRLLREFSTADINALIAPRPHLSLAGDYDPLTPPAGLARIDAQLQAIYRDVGASTAWRLFRSPSAHLETPAMRTEIVRFLKEWL